MVFISIALLILNQILLMENLLLANNRTNFQSNEQQAESVTIALSCYQLADSMTFSLNLWFRHQKHPEFQN